MGRRGGREEVSWEPFQRQEGDGLGLAGNSKGSEKWLGLVHILKGDLVRFADGLDDTSEKKKL